jgi:hypothetical protein
VVTEADLVTSADEVFLADDKEETSHAQRHPR